MSEFVDLSHVIEDGMVTYPGLPGPSIGDHLSREESRGHYAPGVEFHIGKIEMVANTGTYLDVPVHRYPEGSGLQDLLLAQIADLPGVCVAAAGRAIGVGALDSIDVFGRAVLFATGWSRYWGTDAYGSPEHPFLTAEVCEMLVEGGATLVGIDSVNIDDTRGGERPAHSMLLAGGIPIVEHLTGIERLAGRNFRFSAVPPKVVGLGSWPVRAFAVVE
jgi:kynurenine formamidase